MKALQQNPHITESLGCILNRYCGKFAFDFAQHFLQNIFKAKRIKVQSRLSVNK